MNNLVIKHVFLHASYLAAIYVPLTGILSCTAPPDPHAMIMPSLAAEKRSLASALSLNTLHKVVKNNYYINLEIVYCTSPSTVLSIYCG